MKRTLFGLALLAVFALTGCVNEFNQVTKTSDYDYKYEYAKQCFASGKFVKASSLLRDIVTIMKGSENGQECLYMLGMADFSSRDYESAAETFQKYYKTYPKGEYAERACFHIGQSLYQSAPEPRLDQTPTMSAIAAYQLFLDNYPNSDLRDAAQDRLFELEDKLVTKEYLSAKLYYDLGDYFGNCLSGGSNFEACIITAQNALKNYPYTDKREDFSILIIKSKYELAQQSIEAKKLDRYRDAEDECYGFLNEFPESKDCDLVKKMIAKCEHITKGHSTED